MSGRVPSSAADVLLGQSDVELINTANRTSYTTDGESLILVDTGSAAGTITLSAQDLDNRQAIVIVNISGANTLTVDTEGSANIEPGGASSKDIDAQGWGVQFSSEGTLWESTLLGEYDQVALNETGTQPSNNGEMRMDSGTVYVQTGGSTKNLDNIGSGGGKSRSASDSGGVVVADFDDLNFNNNLTVTDDGDDTVTIDASGGGLSGTEKDMGTITLTTGSTPAFDGTLTDVAADEDIKIDSVRVFPDPDDQVAADYDFNHDWTRKWDESDGAVDIGLTVNWDNDPGSNITARVEVLYRT